MRWLLIAFAVAFLGASSALAKPKVAVTPLAGDGDDKVGETVRELLDGKLAVVAEKDVERAMSKLGVSGELQADDVQKLSQRLDAAVVVQGRLGRAGKKKTVKLTVWVRGKKPSDFNVQYKTVSSDKFRDVVRDALLKRIGSIDELEEGDRPKKRASDEDEGDRPKKKPDDGDEDRPKKRLSDNDGDDDKPKKRVADGDDDKPKKKRTDDDRPKKKIASKDDDDDGPRPKAKKRRRARDGGDGEGVRETAAPLPAARVGAGFGYAARYLTYAVAADSNMRPPKVLTPAPSGHFEAEIYPLALSNPRGPAAGLGLFGEYDKTFGLAIDVPGTMGKSAPINQAHYGIGARYRLAFGRSAVTAGVAYTRRHYIANRSALAQPTQLDAPDVNYAAVSPGLGARTQVASRLALFAELDAMLVLSAGAIAKTENYGAGDVFGFGGTTGFDIAIGKQLGLRFAGEYNQVNLKFKGTGNMAATRKVSAATDRDFGMSATLAAKF